MTEILHILAPSFQASLSGSWLYFSLAAMGAVVGALAGLFGVGGGFLLVPLMNALLGVPIELAAGSTICYIIGTSTTGMVRHVKLGNVEILTAIILSAGSIMGAVFGDVLQNYLIITVSHGNQAQFSNIMQVLFIVLLLVIARLMYREPQRKDSGKTLLQRLPLPPRIDLPEAHLEGVSVPGLVLIGFFGGTLTGLMGVSGGVLFMPILVVAVGFTARLAVGTSLAVVLMASIAAIIKKTLSGGGKVSLVIALALLIASAIGVEVGVLMGQRLDSGKLRRYFAFVIFGAIAVVVVKLILRVG
jgi:uncharacterized membrane protein YfcA